MNTKLLETLIKQGHQVAVKSNNGEWKVFLFIDGEGGFEWTWTARETERCFAYGLYTKEEIENEFTNEYKVITPAPLMLEEGDEVEVIEEAKIFGQKMGWWGAFENISDRKGKITDILNGEYEIEIGNGDIIAVPHRAVSYIEEEEKQMTVAEIQKELGYKFKIVE